jgi:glutathione S-transferase
MLKKARIDFDYEEVNMLKNEHMTGEFEKSHPRKYIPILQDGNAVIYGTTFIMLAHICNRFKKKGKGLCLKNTKRNFHVNSAHLKILKKGL